MNPQSSTTFRKINIRGKSICSAYRKIWIVYNFSTVWIKTLLDEWPVCFGIAKSVSSWLRYPNPSLRWQLMVIGFSLLLIFYLWKDFHLTLVECSSYCDSTQNLWLSSADSKSKLAFKVIGFTFKFCFCFYHLYPVFAEGILFLCCPSIHLSVCLPIMLCFLNILKSHCRSFIKPLIN